MTFFEKSFTLIPMISGITTMKIRDFTIEKESIFTEVPTRTLVAKGRKKGEMSASTMVIASERVPFPLKIEVQVKETTATGPIMYNKKPR